MSFAFPWAVLLLPLPLLLLRLVPPESAVTGAIALPPALGEAARPVRRTPALRHARLVLPCLAWALAVVALSGPRIEQVFDILPASAREIVLVLDLSGSMEREDFSLDGAPVSRLTAVQSVAARFVDGRAGDRVGLVVFGDRAYVAAAPTHDVAAVAQVIGTTRIGVSGKATAIADGLGLAIKRLRERDAKSRSLIAAMSSGKQFVRPGSWFSSRSRGLRLSMVSGGGRLQCMVRVVQNAPHPIGPREIDQPPPLRDFASRHRGGNSG